MTLPSYVGMVTYPKSNVGRMHSVGSDGNIEFFHTINKDNRIFGVISYFAYATDRVSRMTVIFT